MTDIDLENDHLRLTATTGGGAIWRLAAKTPRGEMPLLREPPPGPDRSALASACFPLVPFGNRVSGNRFTMDGVDHTLTPNTPWDRHYLHGDGWMADWTVGQHSTTGLRLGLTHRADGTPYSYDATQEFTLDGRTLTLTLAVTNRGTARLPFGLGWHPYFPLTPNTTLQASAASHWQEGEGWLPTVETPTPPDLDFRHPRPPPRRWVNNGFEQWDGTAQIVWPERQLALRLSAKPVFRRFFLFVSDPIFDPGYAYDFFCFEPMSHSANAHNGRGGGLVALAPGETLRGAVQLSGNILAG